MNLFKQSKQSLLKLISTLTLMTFTVQPLGFSAPIETSATVEQPVVGVQTESAKQNKATNSSTSTSTGVSVASSTDFLQEQTLASTKEADAQAQNTIQSVKPAAIVSTDIKMDPQGDLLSDLTTLTQGIEADIQDELDTGYDTVDGRIYDPKTDQALIQGLTVADGMDIIYGGGDIQELLNPDSNQLHVVGKNQSEETVTETQADGSQLVYESGILQKRMIPNVGTVYYGENGEAESFVSSDGKTRNRIKYLKDADGVIQQIIFETDTYNSSSLSWEPAGLSRTFSASGVLLEVTRSGLTAKIENGQIQSMLSATSVLQSFGWTGTDNFTGEAVLADGSVITVENGILVSLTKKDALGNTVKMTYVNGQVRRIETKDEIYTLVYEKDTAGNLLDIKISDSEHQNVSLIPYLLENDPIILYNDLVIPAEPTNPEEPEVLDPSNNPTLDTSNKVFGAGSLNLDGDGDFLSISDSDDWNFGTGDFTIESRIRLQAFPGDGVYDTIVSQFENSANFWQFSFYSADGNYYLTLDAYTNGEPDISIIRQIADPVSAQTWYHVAVVRRGNEFCFYLDGKQQGASLTQTGSMGDKSGELKVGGFNNRRYFSGWLDELRITKGVARWTANFTPLTSAYQTDSNTKLLMHFDTEEFGNDVGKDTPDEPEEPGDDENPEELPALLSKTHTKLSDLILSSGTHDLLGSVQNTLNGVIGINLDRDSFKSGELIGSSQYDYLHMSLAPASELAVETGRVVVRILGYGNEVLNTWTFTNLTGDVLHQYFPIGDLNKNIRRIEIEYVDAGNGYSPVGVGVDDIALVTLPKVTNYDWLTYMGVGGDATRLIRNDAVTNLVTMLSPVANANFSLMEIFKPRQAIRQPMMYIPGYPGQPSSEIEFSDFRESFGDGTVFEDPAIQTGRILETQLGDGTRIQFERTFSGGHWTRGVYTYADVKVKHLFEFGRVTHVIRPDGHVLDYTYQDLSNGTMIMTVRDTSSGITEQYLNGTQRISRTLSTGVALKYVRDSQGKIVQTDVYDVHGQKVQSFEYSYNESGNLILLRNDGLKVELNAKGEVIKHWTADRTGYEHKTVTVDIATILYADESGLGNNKEIILEGEARDILYELITTGYVWAKDRHCDADVLGSRVLTIYLEDGSQIKMPIEKINQYMGGWNQGRYFGSQLTIIQPDGSSFTISGFTQTGSYDPQEALRFHAYDLISEDMYYFSLKKFLVIGENTLPDGWDQGKLDTVRALVNNGGAIDKTTWAEALNEIIKVKMRLSDYQVVKARTDLYEDFDLKTQNLLTRILAGADLAEKDLLYLNRRILEAYYPDLILKSQVTYISFVKVQNVEEVVLADRFLESGVHLEYTGHGDVISKITLADGTSIKYDSVINNIPEDVTVTFDDQVILEYRDGKPYQVTFLTTEDTNATISLLMENKAVVVQKDIADYWIRRAEAVWESLVVPQWSAYPLDGTVLTQVQYNSSGMVRTHYAEGVTNLYTGGNIATTVGADGEILTQFYYDAFKNIREVDSEWNRVQLQQSVFPEIEAEIMDQYEATIQELNDRRDALLEQIKNDYPGDQAVWAILSAEVDLQYNLAKYKVMQAAKTTYYEYLTEKAAALDELVKERYMPVVTHWYRKIYNREPTALELSKIFGSTVIPTGAGAQYSSPYNVANSGVPFEAYVALFANEAGIQQRSVYFTSLWQMNVDKLKADIQNKRI